MELDEGASVDELLEGEAIPREEVLVSRNDRIISGRHGLKDGDVIEVLDVIAGG